MAALKESPAPAKIRQSISPAQNAGQQKKRRLSICTGWRTVLIPVEMASKPLLKAPPAVEGSYLQKAPLKLPLKILDSGAEIATVLGFETVSKQNRVMLPRFNWRTTVKKRRGMAIIKLSPGGRDRLCVCAEMFGPGLNRL